MAILALILFNVLFFWKAWTNPLSLATSELLSTFFPSWIHQRRGEKNDPYYWLVFNAHPVLSTYYPPSKINSLFGAKKPLDAQFRILVTSILLHFLFASVGWFVLISSWTNSLISVFGAVTLTYSAYNIKQQPCLVYTLSWFPWLLLGIANHDIVLSSIAFGMVLLAGYYPIGIQATLIAVCASIWWDSPLTWIPIGTLIGLPQLIPFLKYLPKTIRSKKHDEIGTVSFNQLLSLLFPESFRKPINGVGFWEMACYVGLVPLVLLASSNGCTSQVWILGVASFILAMGAFNKYFPRIPARWLFTFQFSLGWAATSALNGLHLAPGSVWCLLLIQAFDLWYHNRNLMPTRPYAELTKRPSRVFNTKLTRFLENRPERVSGLPWPLFTGHINRIKTLGYSGGMQLKLMAKWRNDTNPNGSGEHDYFRSNKDNGNLTRYRVRWAFSRKKLDWKLTPIRHLYENPNYC